MITIPCVHSQWYTEATSADVVIVQLDGGKCKIVFSIEKLINILSFSTSGGLIHVYVVNNVVGFKINEYHVGGINFYLSTEIVDSSEEED